MSTDRHGQVRSRLIAVIAVVLGVAALKASATVTLPLAFALFLVALFWPLQHRLERALSQGAQYADQLRQMTEQARSWLQARGLPAPGGTSSAGSDLTKTAVRRAFSFTGSLVLVIAFFVLGLLEVHAFRRKMKHGFPHKGARSWLNPVRRIARDTQRYLVVRTSIGFVTGAGVTLASWTIGLDFAILWGLLNFLLRNTSLITVANGQPVACCSDSNILRRKDAPWRVSTGAFPYRSAFLNRQYPTFI